MPSWPEPRKRWPSGDDNIFLKCSRQDADSCAMSLGLSVLIVDDDPSMLEALQEILEIAGYTPAVARNPFHGLKLAREVKPAVIVCDLLMPNMGGSDVLRTLASDPATAKIPRVLMSGRSDGDHSCANAFLLKPFEPGEILSLIGRMTSATAEPDSNHSPEPHWRG
jgi:CheY-like chemotaxis protein